MKKKNNKIIKILKAIADQNRLKMLELLSCDNLCSCHFVDILEISQPNVSHHLKILKEAGLIQATKRGRWIDYSLKKENLKLIKKEIDNILENNKKDCEFTKINCD